MSEEQITVQQAGAPSDETRVQTETAPSQPVSPEANPSVPGQGAGHQADQQYVTTQQFQDFVENGLISRIQSYPESPASDNCCHKKSVLSGHMLIYFSR